MCNFYLKSVCKVFNLLEEGEGLLFVLRLSGLSLN